MALRKIAKLALVNYTLECGYTRTFGIFNAVTAGPLAVDNNYSFNLNGGSVATLELPPPPGFSDRSVDRPVFASVQ